MMKISKMNWKAMDHAVDCHPTSELKPSARMYFGLGSVLVVAATLMFVFGAVFGASVVMFIGMFYVYMGTAYMRGSSRRKRNKYNNHG